MDSLADRYFSIMKREDERFSWKTWRSFGTGDRFDSILGKIWLKNLESEVKYYNIMKMR